LAPRLVFGETDRELGFVFMAGRAAFALQGEVGEVGMSDIGDDEVGELGDWTGMAFVLLEEESKLGEDMETIFVMLLLNP